MTERNVRRAMLVATIGVVGLLTSLAVAGLLVITRGPQVRALPLVRTLIAQQDPDGATAARTLAPRTADHPPLAWPLPLRTTTTTPILASLVETSGEGPDAAESRPSLSGSTIYTHIPPDFPSDSAPPATTGALAPPASGAPAPAPASDVASRSEAAPSEGHTVVTGGPATVDPVTSSTMPIDMKGEHPARPDEDREVISPRLRVSTVDDDDANGPDYPDDPGN